ncbi:MAG: hypothetical protein LBP20_11545 [Treponema sp.]|jgi:hypothetical protein|nr:hypothetical protein [Treponema sp.]
MNQRIKQLLDGKAENHILPFFWQHGEDEATLRTYMRVIHEASIGAVCVESRPHPDFCGPLWWRDMDIILDEARKRLMQVWILDDSHFPTGFANGAMSKQPDSLRRRSICATVIDCSGKNHIVLNRDDLAHPKPAEKTQIEIAVEQMRKTVRPVFDDDRLLAVIALRTGAIENTVNLSGGIQNGVLEWDVPDGKWKVYILHISANAGYHPEYINMMDEASCRVLIDAVYEPHYARYKNDFGTTIAGFFSDEPEFGNGHLYAQGNVLGTDQDLPWSAELEDTLRAAWGGDFVSLLPLLWENPQNAAAREITARVRYGYMDAVTRLAEKDFSKQIGGWCHARGVEYIGHIIEDNNQHARTGSSLGHYFRSMSGQDMSGIDDIGGQVFPQGEDINITGQLFDNRNGEFYHYVLGKLASSYAAIDPAKRGRAMCEIFGNYGWAEGVRLEKYLADHFMVRGVNNFVPHAFSPKAFPDPDCPPHFYAHGHNPQYRHFGALMAYMNRICALISGGKHIAQAAVLYHGEAEWVGAYMPMEKPCRLLGDTQIEYDIIPQDVFAERDRYKTVLGKTLRVNTQEYRVLIVPYSQYVTKVFAGAVHALLAAGFPVIFIDALPEGFCDSAPHDTGATAGMDEMFAGSRVLALDTLIPCLRDMCGHEMTISPADDRIRYLHYVHDDGMSIFYLVNEGAAVWKGVVNFSCTRPCAAYDAWNNRLEAVKAHVNGGGTEIAAEIEPLKSLIIVFDDALLPGDIGKPTVKPQGCIIDLDGGWTRSVCDAIEYPLFKEAEKVNLPDRLAEEKPEFSGFVRYERPVILNAEAAAKSPLVLEITDAYEGIELFVNGVPAGIQIAPPFRYDIAPLVQAGENTIAIEAATTLERQIKPAGYAAMRASSRPKAPTGITGQVKLYLQGDPS